MNKITKIILLGIMGAFGLLFLLIVVGIVVSTNLPEPASPSPVEETAVEAEEVEETAKPEETVADPPAEEEKAAGVGEILEVGGVAFTVLSRDKATNVGGEWGVNSNGEFLILDVVVENKGNEPITVDSSFFTLLGNGKSYEADTSAGVYANKDNHFFYDKVNPDIALQGKVVFDVPAELHGQELKLKVQTGFFGTETGEIDLQ